MHSVALWPPRKLDQATKTLPWGDAAARRKVLEPARFLRRNDSHSFFKRAGGQIVTGPTGTNVNDLYVAVVL